VRENENTQHGFILILHGFGKEHRNVLRFRKMILLVWRELRRFMRDKTRILVVDDEMAVALMIVCLLTRAGCEVEAALDAKKALRLAQTEAFDLIILDVDMPSGFAICRSLKENPFFQTPVAFVCARFGEDDVQRDLDLGAVDYIEKPFDAQNFVSRILAHTKLAQTESSYAC